MQYLIRFVNNPFKHGAITALCLFLFCSCNQRREKDVHIPLITQYLIDSIYLPITEMDSPSGRIKEVDNTEGSNDEIVSFIKESNNNLYFYSIKKQEYLDSISLAAYHNEYPDFYPVGIDSVYIELESNKIVRIFRNVMKSWNVSPITQIIGPKVFIGALSAYPLQVFGDTIICTTTTSERRKNEGPNIPFIQSNFDIMFKLLADSVQFIAKYNPNPKYFLQQDYNSDVEKVYLNRNEIVYSFDHSDTLTLHNFETGHTKKVKLQTENFFPNTPFDYSKTMDYKYLNEYTMSNSRFGMGSLFYSKAQHRIYQLMQHKGKYIEENGKKNDYTDLPKSLFVLDEQLNQLKEIYIPPRTFSSKFFAFTTHKGIYFAAHKSKQRYNDKMLFYRIVVR